MAMLTEAMQDYLKTIWRLEREKGTPVSTSAIAEGMGFAPASVTNMAQRLAKLNLVDYKPYRGLVLTSAGEKVALEIIRHHRLIELYLAEALGYSWDAVHEEADRLEHHISEEFESAIAEQLGHPTHDPHGDPIPTEDLQLTFSTAQPLTTLAPDTPCIVRRVRDQSAEKLRYLADAGLVLTSVIRLIASAPSEESVVVGVRGREVTITYELAESIMVEPIASPGDGAEHSVGRQEKAD